MSFVFFSSGHASWTPQKAGAPFLLPTSFHPRAPSFHSSAAATGADTVIVHCALSQVRGPACARRLNERLAVVAVAGGDGSAPAPPRIAVLTGGFDGWEAVYGKDGAVTEQRM